MVLVLTKFSIGQFEKDIKTYGLTNSVIDKEVVVASVLLGGAIDEKVATKK